jgi:type IV secretion system protein VirB7
MKRLSILACLALALQGCASYAGPFVTSVSSDGNGGLNVQSCMVRLERFTKTVSNADCTSQHIQLRARHHRDGQ